MLDYKLIEAFAKVVAEGGFERAARVLFISQSAVSQRIRQLEEQCGQLLLTRTSPPQPTAAGKELLKHYQQVKLLEDGLTTELINAEEHGPISLAIGINADSLASWFIASIQPLLRQFKLLIDLRVEDQEQTHLFLREGEVVGCISNEPKPMQGCRVEFLGLMNYRLLATPEFIERWFPEGLSLATVLCAPAVIFNRKDRLHQLFLEQHLKKVSPNLPCHYIPTPEQFLQVIVEGYSYGMVPDWQSVHLRNSGELMELVPGAAYPVELYWHCWNLQSKSLAEFSSQLTRGAKQLLADRR
ncbi:LysR family transcriptional regulator ArgP [Malonomonas rubra]|uniref:LysR family transcriptional regulator ArgP n=1 Tax=Malonomonas rubra TaxID=57040 RepID=UPI0026F28412|nr:LysR family transcriptional regulator ArgP [Malonomonas rubra]